MQDPAILLRQRELDIREQEAMGRIQNAQQKLELDAFRIGNKVNLDEQRIDQAREIAADKIRAQVFGDVMSASSKTEGMETQERMKAAEMLQEEFRQDSEDARQAERVRLEEDKAIASIIEKLRGLDRKELESINSSISRNNSGDEE